ncbi:MAG: acyl carrier protein [Planctomycetes bacterium]|nr:acyl carrier protein [Planctomycetota bacterium]
MTDQVQVRAFIIGWLEEYAKARAMTLPAVADDTDLLESGLVDSMGFVELISAIEGRFGCEVDFGQLCSDNFTTLGGLVASVASPCAV